MNFYKILFQSNKKVPPLYEQLILENCMIVGTQGYSYGVDYSPEVYNKWLMDEEIFNFFVHSSVKQLIMTNYKFLYLISNQSVFNLNIVDCQLENCNIEDLLQGEEIEPEILKEVLKIYDYRILQVYFRSKEKNLITLKANGVLGFDNNLNEEELNDIRKLVDFLGFGPAVIL